jgi:hypothetical protein
MTCVALLSITASLLRLTDIELSSSNRLRVARFKIVSFAIFSALWLLIYSKVWQNTILLFAAMPGKIAKYLVENISF